MNGGACTSRTVIKVPGGDDELGGITLRLEDLNLSARLHDTDHDEVATLEFKNIAAYRFTSSSHSSGYDRACVGSVIELIGSSWEGELRKPTMWPFVTRHFEVYFEDVGWLQVLAEEVCLL